MDIGDPLINVQHRRELLIRNQIIFIKYSGLSHTHIYYIITVDDIAGVVISFNGYAKDRL